LIAGLFLAMTAATAEETSHAEPTAKEPASLSSPNSSAPAEVKSDVAKDNDMSQPTASADEHAPEKPAPHLHAPVEVTATRSLKPLFDSPNSVEVETEEGLRERKQARTLIEAFREMPGVMVQKTAQGQGSPFIRGFTGFQNLLMIDGVRFNRSFFRSGPIQYWATVDALTVERLEVAKGSGAILYGSDAVGGAVNVLTRGTDTWGAGNHFGGGAFYRLGTAERSNTGRVEVQGSHKDKVGFLLGGTFRDHDDFVAGGGTGVVENSGYEEYGADCKVQVRPTNNQEVTFLFQGWHQEEVPRTEQTVYSKPFHGTVAGTELRRDTDHDRLLSYVKYSLKNDSAAVEEMQATVSYQFAREEQFRRRAGGREDITGLRADTLGVAVNFASPTVIGRLTYGLDYYRDFTDTWRKDYNADGSLRAVRIQGAVGDDATYDLAGLYAQTEKSFFDEFLTLTAAGRFTYAATDVGRYEDPVSGNEAALSDSWTNLSGSLRFLIRPDRSAGDHWRIFGGVAQAFRAPNLSDLTAFEATSTMETPAPSLEPETYLTTEFGVRANYRPVSFSAAWFRTFTGNQIVKSPTGLLISGVPEVRKDNVGRGYVQGIEGCADWEFARNWRLWSKLTWTEGEVDQYEDDVKRRKPWTRLIPLVGHYGLRYERAGEGKLKWWAEAYGSAATKADRLALQDRTDVRRIPPGGTPGYAVCGVRGGVHFAKEKLRLSAGVENLGNIKYRVHGSGQNEPGTNFVLSLDWKF
jgi:hemoglobin/transferrin/lactoferrin receptor protein